MWLVQTERVLRAYSRTFVTSRHPFSRQRSSLGWSSTSSKAVSSPLRCPNYLVVVTRALCFVSVLNADLCSTLHLHIACVVYEFDLGAHSSLFGMMETKMGGAVRSSDAQEDLAQGVSPPTDPANVLLGDEYTPREAGDDDLDWGSTETMPWCSSTKNPR